MLANLWEERMTICMAMVAAALALGPAALPASERVTLSGRVGAHTLAFRATVVRTSATFRVRPADAELIAVTELRAGAAQPAPYRYLVTGDGLRPAEREATARGFGPVTWFLRPRAPAGRLTILNLRERERGPAIVEVRGVSRAEIERARRNDRFALMGLIGSPWLGMPEEEQIARLASRLPVVAGGRFGAGFCREIPYAARDEAGVRAAIREAREWSRRHRLPVLLGLVSWWAGTPRRVPDGLGGQFGDLRYQQVCYTPEATHPEDPELRALLGARYSRHYRRTVPNIWSNTPWLTMNSPRLNAHRERCLRVAIRVLREESRGDASWIAGVFLENEPRYWDTQSTQGTPQWAGEQWADFNPLTVADATRDGVTLDPADGMSPAELEWLDRNVGRYFQRTVDAARRALREQGLLGRFPLLTHSLQVPLLFPGSKMNRTPADWAWARGAVTGIEGIWSNLSDYDRVREWGSWCNLNREETDGLPLDAHLWDLRVTYAAGGFLYNSYNWHILPNDGLFAYMKSFTQSLPSVEVAPAKAEPAGPAALLVTPPPELQACDEMRVAVRAAGRSRAYGLALVVRSPSGAVWRSERRAPPPDGEPAAFAFPAPAEMSWQAPSRVEVEAYGADGRPLPGAVVFADGAASGVRLRLDLEEARRRSLLVIGWARAAAR